LLVDIRIWIYKNNDGSGRPKKQTDPKHWLSLVKYILTYLMFIDARIASAKTPRGEEWRGESSVVTGGH
jgi:hypothetical protein